MHPIPRRFQYDRAVRGWRAIAIALWLVCGLAGDARAQLTTSVYASGFSQPVAVVQDPTDRAVQFVVEQTGRIRVVRNGAILPADFLNLSGSISTGGERGLLGLAFAPDYATSRRFFVNFTNPDGHTVIARFRRSADPVIADPGSRFDLRWGGSGGPGFIAQPFSNHNGGNLAFGPDGLLYIGLGDGGSGNDPDHRAQNPAELLGKMLRIDVNVLDSHASGYQVPSDNPFAGGGGPVGTRPEIWSFGLRNPWKYSFDDPGRGGTGALVLADVGQGRFEEIDYEPANRGGRNYGWRNREGAHDNVTSLPPAFLPLVNPIYEYDHVAGQSITGGYVYRGRRLSSTFRGRYFFADFIAGRVWSIRLTIDPTTKEATASDLIEHTADLGGFSRLGNISAFGVDANAELFILSYSRGTLLRVLDTHPRSPDPGDYDGDGKADLALYRPSMGIWYIKQSTTNYMDYSATAWGLSTDIPLPGDYDGDGRDDLALYRRSMGMCTWYVLQSSTNYMTYLATQWGLSTDVPVPGDYDGDGKADLGVYRPSTGFWYILQSSTNYTSYVAIQWGLSTDVTVPGDYDGDGKVDLGLYRPSTGIWYVKLSSTGYTTYIAQPWGLSTDTPVPGDYDGDGKTDLGLYRPSTGMWYVLQSSTSYLTYSSQQWGLSTDTPVPGDFDGDGKADLGLYRPSTGIWYILQSSTNYTNYLATQWGLSTDIPLPRRPS
jgi:glucose/arabinose dehydrogenase